MYAFEQQFGFALDAVYTAKMFYGLFNDIRGDKFAPGTRIIAVHTGGLQGNGGFSQLTNNNAAAQYPAFSCSSSFSC